MDRYRRQIKTIDRKISSKISLYSISILVFILSLTVFLVGQVMINNKLSPLGIELQSLNNEKNSLIEENRTHEQTLAGIKSLTALEIATKKETKLKQVTAKQIIYIQDTLTQASR